MISPLPSTVFICSGRCFIIKSEKSLPCPKYGWKPTETMSTNQEYCETLIDKTEDDLKQLELEVSDAGKAIADYKESIATLGDEISALEAGIKALSKKSIRVRIKWVR
jgi:flagellar motility protein MotE (MotC chaperone)